MNSRLNLNNENDRVVPPLAFKTNDNPCQLKGTDCASKVNYNKTIENAYKEWKQNNATKFWG